MAMATSLFSFLRPLGMPRQSSVRHFLRFSTATRFHVEASPLSTPKTSSPPPPPPSTPQEASRAADLAAAEASTESDSACSPASKPLLPSKRREHEDAASSPILTPPYHVGRSNNKHIPVYTDFKRGGNLHQTIIRKITGDLAVLREEMITLLGKEEKDVRINHVTKQVVIKGKHKLQVMAYLAAKGF